MLTVLAASTNWQSESWLYGVFPASPLLSNVLFIVWRQHASVSHCHCLPYNLCALLAYLYCKVVPVHHVNALERERERLNILTHRYDKTRPPSQYFYIHKQVQYLS